VHLEFIRFRELLRSVGSQVDIARVRLHIARKIHRLDYVPKLRRHFRWEWVVPAEAQLCHLTKQLPESQSRWLHNFRLVEEVRNKFHQISQGVLFKAAVTV